MVGDFKSKFDVVPQKSDSVNETHRIHSLIL